LQKFRPPPPLPRKHKSLNVSWIPDDEYPDLKYGFELLPPKTSHPTKRNKTKKKSERKIFLLTTLHYVIMIEVCGTLGIIKQKILKYKRIFFKKNPWGRGNIIYVNMLMVCLRYAYEIWDDSLIPSDGNLR